MPLIKHHRLTDDPWVSVDDAAGLPDGTPVIVSVERWRGERDALIRRGGPLGIRLAADQSPDDIADDLDRFEVVALHFPKFTDGRAYSTARLLRERHGFEGEIRATGQVLRDQFLFMWRCGFDAFEVASTDALEAWHKAMGELSLSYQPAADDRIPAHALRRRRARETAGAASRPGESEHAPREACRAGDWAY